MTVDVNMQIRLFTEVFKILWQQKRIDWLSARVDERLLIYSPLDLSELIHLLPNLDKQRIKGEFGAKYFWLSSDSGVQPVMNLKFDFSRDLPKINIRLGLFIKHSDGENAFGLRYESPEGTNAQGQGTHHYYHVQLIRGFKKDNNFVYPCPEWLPVTQPALPLPATDSVSLLLCFIASLYGISEVHGFFQKIEGLKEYSKTRPFLPFDSLRWYRLMASRNSEQKHHYEVDAETADTELRRRHHNIRVLPI